MTHWTKVTDTSGSHTTVEATAQTYQKAAANANAPLFMRPFEDAGGEIDFRFLVGTYAERDRRFWRVRSDVPTAVISSGIEQP